MSFGEAVRSVFSKYGTFSGRARRSEFWWFSLFIGLVLAAIWTIDAITQNSALAVVGLVVMLAMIIPGLAVTVRRLHDTGRSGWWYFIAVIPLIGPIVLLVFECQDSQAGPNTYGPSPKYAGQDPHQPVNPSPAY